MRFSFVIPTYNNKVLLKNTLEALNNQIGYSSKDYEVVLVDDGSNDNTKQYIENVNKNYCIKYIYIDRTEASCRAKTRNTGWRAAKGKIIIFIDSDILIKPTHLFEIDRCFKFNQNIIVIGNRLMMDKAPSYQDIHDGKVFKQNIFDGSELELLDSRYFMYNKYSFNISIHWYQWMHVYSCNMAVLKKNLNKIGGFDENFKEWGMEDIEVGFNLFKHGIKVILNYRLEVLHQYHGARSDLSIAKEKLQGYYKNVEYFINKHPDSVTIDKRFVTKYFSGEIPLELLQLNTEPEPQAVRFDYTNLSKYNGIKKSLKSSLRFQKITLLYDNSENSDIDLWIQFYGRSKIGVIRYFPVSKIIMPQTMEKYLNIKRNIRNNRVTK